MRSRGRQPTVRSRSGTGGSVRARPSVAALLAAVTLLPGCRHVDEIRERFRDVTSHESYARSLESAELSETALGREWTEAARRALLDPLPVELPYREEGYLSADEAPALGFLVDLERGQRLSVDLEIVGEPGRVFVDLYRADPSGEREPLFVASADSATNELSYTVGRGGPFVLRIQPELLRGGEYQLTVRSGASLAFPVAGADSRQIQSYFGADRDGGRRSHHGVDIFMPRGTPVVAGTAGRVSRVRETSRGGKVIWLRDREQNQSLYYAHLDSQIVREGAMVRPGQILGLVGNTGNARTTPPHLHFGIYLRGEGPVNPYPFLREPSERLPTLTADRSLVDGWVRSTVDAARLRGHPSARAPVLVELALHTPARVDAVAGAFYRISLPDGRRGYVAARLAEGAEEPLSRTTADEATPLRALPLDGAPVVERAGPGSTLPVLGTFEDYLMVRGASGRTGWIPLVGQAADAGG